MLFQYGFGLAILQCAFRTMHGKSPPWKVDPMAHVSKPPPWKLDPTAHFTTTVKTTVEDHTKDGGTTVTPPLWTFGTLWELFANQTTWKDLTTPAPTMEIETTTIKDIDVILRHAKIIPDVIDKKPPDELFVSYYHFSWNFGQVFDVTDVNEPPHHLWWISELRTYYTLLMISPDFPGEHDHSMAQYQHWIVVNIPGIWIEGGETLAAYLGTEPYGIGRHRIVLLLFKQPGREKIQFTNELIYTKKDVFNRGNFSALRFAKKYGLGDPLAINFFILDMDVLPKPYY